ncbi:MAG: DUF4232 domain-containing protein [Solirubrobacteraceae bacterium]
MLTRRFAVVLAALLGCWALAACGGSSPTSGGGGSGSATTVTVTRPPVTVTAPDRTTTGASTTTGTGTATTGTTTNVAGGAACVAAELTGYFLGTNGAAGTIAIGFALRNTSAAPCHTYGWPGVLLLSTSGVQLPTDAKRTTSDMIGSTPPVELTLQPGQEASFRMIASQFAEGGGAGCQNASILQIIAPDDSATLRVPISGGIPACGNATLSPLMAGRSAWPRQ